ncbi:MAG: M3 family oligoendopeptidase [Firmicutes bacterium]|nr:M3 family oligoendopeptidase [Bacillota bacterium]
MKFSDMPYTRPDMEQAAAEAKAFTARLKNAKSYQELKSAYLAHEKERAALRNQMTIASIRNTINTQDAFYENEMNFLNAEMPKLSLIEKEAGKALLESPFLADFVAEFGPTSVNRLKAQQRLQSEAVIENRVKDASLRQQYSKAVAGCTTEFNGETCNFYGLLKYMEEPDRSVRKAAFEAWARMYEQVAPELDRIYDEMIKVRCDMAKKLGFESYIEMAYLERGRYDYNQQDAQAFRRQVREEITPLAKELFDRQKAALGIDHLYYYDEAISDPAGNASPKGDRDQLVLAAQEMYRELSEETGRFFDRMVEDQMFDLETKPGKRGGGYCTFLPGPKMPFIFSNFNGTSADVDVLTHEAGHAFQAFTASRALPLMEQVHSGAEVAEIHSMAMEYWTYPWMELFFGDQADKYRYDHLASSFSNVPYLVSVDEFQEKVFENPEMSAKERRQVWHEIEQTYMPWRDYDGNAFLEEGGFWMQKQHIFLFPFYYIEYAMAIMGAFEFYTRQKEDRPVAWADYLRLCEAGGSKGYFDLLQYAGLSIPVKPGAVKNCIRGIVEELGLAEAEQESPANSANPSESPAGAEAGETAAEAASGDDPDELGLLTELLPCRVCHEDCAYFETEGDWCLYVACGNCGSTTAFCAYNNPAEKKEAMKKAAQLWNMGKVIAERRGE